MVDNDSSRLNPQGGSLREALEKVFAKHIFTNRYTVHPAQVTELVEKLMDSFELYLTAHDDGPVADLGGELAEHGVGVRTVMESLAVLRRSAPDSPWTDSYTTAFAEGFVSAGESEVLSEQERVRRALTTVLEAQERELRVKNQAIEGSINGVLFASTEGKITYVNPSFLAMWGYASAEEILGKDIREVWADGEAPAIVERLTSAGAWRGELPARRSDGRSMTVGLSTSPIRNGDEESIGVMASFVDLTESKRLEHEMQQVQKMDDLGQLASGIVHDFNNLLASIGGYLQLVLLETPSSGQTHRDLLQIKEAVDRGAGLTKQLGYFTRQTTGKREIVDLNTLATETGELLKRTFPADIDIRLEKGRELWSVEADPNQISQVIMNLCVNARDAIVEKSSSGESGGAARVSIRTENVELSELGARQYVNVEPGRYVALRIIDTGTGMDSETQKRLFVPFFTTKKETSRTGLGLAVAYGIVRSHRGFVAVESTANVGTTISLYLPTAGSVAPTASEPRPGNGFAQGQGTVLVVDDEPGVREVISRALTVSGYEVLVAPGGQEALVEFDERNGKIDLVILDMVMPEMDGEQTLAKLRARDPNLTALFITGYTSDDRLHRLEQEGLIEVLEKPVDLRHLSERVGALTGSANG